MALLILCIPFPSWWKALIFPLSQNTQNHDLFHHWCSWLLIWTNFIWDIWNWWFSQTLSHVSLGEGVCCNMYGILWSENMGTFSYYRSLLYPGEAFRIKEEKARRLHIALQAISTPAECAPKSAELSGLRYSLKLFRGVDAPIASWEFLKLSCPIPIIPTQTGSTGLCPPLCGPSLPKHRIGLSLAKSDQWFYFKEIK